MSSPTGTAPWAPWPVEELSPTSFEVTCPEGGGSVESWGDSLTVYVDQPGRSAVVGSARFAALHRAHDGGVSRVEGTADDSVALASAVLGAFDADGATPERLAGARRVRVAELGAGLERFATWADVRAEQFAQLRRLLAERRVELDAVAKDPSRPLPMGDEAAVEACRRFPDLFR